MPPHLNRLPNLPSTSAPNADASSSATVQPQHGATGAHTPPRPGQPPAPGAATQQGRRGPLAALSNFARHPGKSTRKAMQKAEADTAPAASASYELWSASNAAAAAGGIASHFNGSSDATRLVSDITNGTGMLPQTLDIAATSLAYANKTIAVVQTGKEVANTEAGTLGGNDARAAHGQAKESLAQATPGALRDVGLGADYLAARVGSAVKHGQSIYGNDALVADGALGLVGGAAYIGAGALQSRNVDRAVDRVQLLNAAVSRPASARRDTGDAGTESPTIRALDDLFAADRLSPNAYSILRTRSEPEVASFLRNRAALGLAGQEKLNDLLHFPGERNLMRVLNFGRQTNLNSASMRRGAREAVIDTLISARIRPGLAGLTLESLKTARAEALGKPMAPAVAAAEAQLQRAGVDAGEFSQNTLRALAAAGHDTTRQFVDRYRALPAGERQQLHAALHFGSWRFWKADATLPTTKPQRADIRTALVTHFARGASVERVTALKLRYNEQVLPLRTGRTHAQPGTPDTLRAHILAHQDLKLERLKEEKRHAKVQVGYGAAVSALTTAELAVNPLAGAGISASRVVMSPVYLAYAGRRGIVAGINRHNARPIDARMREEALLRAMPSVHARIAQGDARPVALAAPAAFLANTLKLAPAQLKQIDTLQRTGQTGAIEALLRQHAPDANAQIALRVLAERCAGVSGNPSQQAEARAFVQAEASTSGYAPLANIGEAGNPETAFAQLKAHFLERAAQDPAAALPALAQRLSAGGEAAAHDATLLGFDTRPFEGQPPDRIAAELATRFAQDNPVYATRVFNAQLRGGGASAAAARNLLRDLRFTETELHELADKPRGEAAAWLGEHLFGENLRRRFSNAVLDPRGVEAASHLAERMPLHTADAAEPLTWRHGLEQAGVRVIDNPGSPGLDSMLHALYQQLSGSTDASPHASARKVMEARRRVLAELTQGQPDRHVDVTRERDTIVRIAAAAFGKPGATARIVDASGAGESVVAGGNRAVHRGAGSPVAAVLAHDGHTGRSFALHGGEARKLAANTPAATDASHRAGRASLDSQHTLDADKDLEKDLDAALDDRLDEDKRARASRQAASLARAPLGAGGDAAHQPLRTRGRRHDPNAITSNDDDDDRDMARRPPDSEFDAVSKELLGAAGIEVPDGETLLPPAAVHRAESPTLRTGTPSDSPLAAARAAGTAGTGGDTGEIRSLDDLKRFITETGHAGESVALGRSTVSTGQEMLFGYRGLVYRGDPRPPREVLQAGGFASSNPLDDDAHRLEAQGLGASKGATGESGVATSKHGADALSRLAAQGPVQRAHVYIADTRGLDGTDAAYDVTRTLSEAGHLQAGQDPLGSDDPTGSLVNATHVPASAIVGWATLDDMPSVAHALNAAGPGARATLLAELVKTGAASVHLHDPNAPIDD